jgi:hypothetical protein
MISTVTVSTVSTVTTVALAGSVGLIHRPLLMLLVRKSWPVGRQPSLQTLSKARISASSRWSSPMIVVKVIDIIKF